jgi:hypothetical protein
LKESRISFNSPGREEGDKLCRSSGRIGLKGEGLAFSSEEKGGRIELNKNLKREKAKK